jgi:hypothetical protein
MPPIYNKICPKRDSARREQMGSFGGGSWALIVDKLVAAVTTIERLYPEQSRPAPAACVLGKIVRAWVAVLGRQVVGFTPPPPYVGVGREKWCRSKP